MATGSREEAAVPVRLGERRTSDVVVRVRTEGGGRDEWFYCHSHLLSRTSRYFADRLSPMWPTCHILDSRICVDLLCPDRDFDSHVSALRLLYSPTPLLPAAFHNVRNALGILRVAIKLGCQQLADSCFGFLEASPWDEAEEEEILRSVPGFGSQYLPILARLQPVDSSSITAMFVSALRIATSCSPSGMHELKTSAQEQIEYMLTEDDDAPVLNYSDLFKAEVKKCMSNLTIQFDDFLGSLQSYPANDAVKAETIDTYKSQLADLLWACQILTKIELMKDVVIFWVEASKKIVETVEHLNVQGVMVAVELKVVEVAGKVLEAIGYGHVIITTTKRLEMVKVWLPFAQKTKTLIDSLDLSSEEDDTQVKIDGEMWQVLEAALVSIILTLPSEDQAVILADWLRDEHVRYPDLSEAFEIWCYRHKVARSRMALLGGCNVVNSEDRDISS